MYVQVKSSNGITTIPIETKLLANRRVFLCGDINDSLADQFLKQIMLLNDEDPTENIDVIINTNGGEINSGMSIYDAIQTSPAPVRIFCTGKAYSMGAILLACGRHGRYMLPHSRAMIHEPLIGNLVHGSSSTVKEISDSLMKTRKKMNEILAMHTGRTEKEIEEATSYDHFFTSEESIAFGLCDSIVGFDAFRKG